MKNIIAHFTKNNETFMNDLKTIGRISQDGNKSTVKEISPPISLYTDSDFSKNIINIVNRLFSIKISNTQNLKSVIHLLEIQISKDLLIGIYLSDLLNKLSGKINKTKFFKYSLISAIAAQKLEKLLFNTQSENTFLAILMQDVGILVIDHLYPDFYKGLDHKEIHASKTLALEKSILGSNRIDITNWLLKECGASVIAPYTSNQKMSKIDQNNFIEKCSFFTRHLAYYFLDSDNESSIDIFRQIQPYCLLNLSQYDYIISEVQSVLDSLSRSVNTKKLKIKTTSRRHHTGDYSSPEIYRKYLSSTKPLAISTNDTSGQKSNSDFINSYDPITNVFSKTFFEICLGEQYKNSKKHGTPMTVCLLKVDNFNLVVRKHGRETANEILHGTAQLLKNTTPDDAHIARYGDSVFALLLPETDKFQAHSLCQRLVNTKHTLTPNCNLTTSFNLTFSIAVLTHDQDSYFTSIEELLDAICSTLYTAKLLGGSRLLQCKHKMSTSSSTH